MSAVSAAEVKKLRDMTSAGYGDCRKALMQANGDVDEAVKILRTQGQAKAEKKQGRATAEGMVKYLIADDKRSYAMVEVNCETDFVAREDSFTVFVDQLLKLVLDQSIQNVEGLASHPLADSDSVEAARADLVLRVGENIQISRVAFHSTDKGFYFGYQHGQKLSVVCELDQDKPDLGKEVGIHIAAMNPTAIKPEDLPESLLNEERSIYEAQLKDSGKPAEIQSKIIDGKMKKFCAGVCLYGQDYVKDSSMTVEAFVKQQGIVVLSFQRLSVGG